jgi:S1-C subfamily serine protease
MRAKLFILSCILLITGCNNDPIAMYDKPVNIDQCMNAVVHIRAYMDEYQYMTEDYLYDDFQGAWQGSGCFIREDGVILTAGHVVRGAKRFEITLRDGTVLESSVAWAADNMDVGFIKVEIPEGCVAPYLKFDTDGVKLTEAVYILGHPLGWMNNWTVSKGIISNTARDCEGFFGVFDVIQSDSASYPGNSGGPVVDENGRVVGVLVGGIQGMECLSYIVPSWIAKEWSDVFFEWLDTREK